MRVQFLGTGTSQGVPIISCDCLVCSSDDPHDTRLRTSIMIQADSQNILIDTGPDLRAQLLRAGTSSLDAVLITHEHNDHVIGLDDLRPLIFQRNSPMPLYGIKRVLDEIRDRFSYAFEDNPYPGVPKIELHSIEYFEAFLVGDLSFLAIPVVHGNIDVAAYRLRNFCYVTDAKTVSEKSISMMENLDVLVVNCLRMERHHSHFNLSEALDFIKRLAPRKTYLTHIGHSLGKSEEIARKLPKNVFLAFDGLEIEI